MNSKLWELIRLIRPHQWLKNGFVLIGPFFAHAWGEPGMAYAVLLTFMAFSFGASAIYILNDYLDREEDRRHPHKMNRPLARGSVSVSTALLMAAGLFLASLLLAWLVGEVVLLLLLIYFIINSAYSWKLKHVVILDVFIISAGFMLRILAGTIGLDIAPSSWLLLTGLMVTLFLGFSKRRAELVSAGEGETRKVLESYSISMLDLAIGISASGIIMAYSLYTMSPETIAIHKTSNLVYTVPFVLYGLFRYLHLNYSKQGGEDAASDLLRDPHLLLTVIAWGIVTFGIFQ